MKATVRLCDLCPAEGFTTLADGTYTTTKGNTFDACEEHLEQCASFGFTIHKFELPGNVDPTEF